MKLESSPVDKAYSIRNHLGGEVGYVETGLEPISAFACETATTTEALLKVGYVAVEVPPVRRGKN